MNANSITPKLCDVEVMHLMSDEPDVFPIITDKHAAATNTC